MPRGDKPARFSHPLELWPKDARRPHRQRRDRGMPNGLRKARSARRILTRSPPRQRATSNALGRAGPRRGLLRACSAPRTRCRSPLVQWRRRCGTSRCSATSASPYNSLISSPSMLRRRPHGRTKARPGATPRLGCATRLMVARSRDLSGRGFARCQAPTSDVAKGPVGLLRAGARTRARRYS